MIKVARQKVEKERRGRWVGRKINNHECDCVITKLKKEERLKITCEVDWLRDDSGRRDLMQEM
jgi:uncharacterized protein YndB with AHSA1/START domain